MSDDSIPPVELPFANDTGASQPAATGASPAEPFSLDDVEEDDLFGSGDEAQVPAVSSAAAVVRPKPPRGEGDELFTEDIDDADLFGSEVGDDDLHVDEKELFGDDDDSHDITSPGSTPRPGSSAKPGTPRIGGGARGQPSTPASLGHASGEPVPGTPSEMYSEMDEREIFGDISDDEGMGADKAVDVVLLRRTLPETKRPITSMRLPNILAVEKSAFNPNCIPAWMIEGYKEGTNTQEKEVVKLMTPENVIRWRFRRNADGGMVHDDIGRPLYEANSRIVEWEDGSKTLFVGGEAYNYSEVADKVALFEENTADVSVCHGMIRSRTIITPRALDSEAHESLKKAQYRKYEPVRRSLLQTTDEQAAAKELLELQEGQNRRLEKSKKRAVADEERGMTAAFLEDEPEAGDGPSVLDLKNAAKKPRI